MGVVYSKLMNSRDEKRRSYRDVLVNSNDEVSTTKTTTTTTKTTTDHHEIVVVKPPPSYHRTPDNTINHMNATQRLKYIIDIEGFRVNGKFYAKELGVIDVDNESVWSIYYKVGSFAKLNQQDRNQAIYLTNNVHGLRFEDEEDDEDQSSLLEDIRYLAERASYLGRCIGYKGGHYERDLLESLGYGRYAYNIEILGCPRFEYIANMCLSWYERAKKHQCSRHVNPSGILPPRPSEIRSGVHTRVLHCPRVELYCFLLWLRVKIAVPDS